jgi:hypothetical protein
VGGVPGVQAEGMSVADALQRLRGQVGTMAGISVMRGGEHLDVIVVRALVVH